LRPSRIVRASPEELRLERGRLPEGEGRARDLEARAISLARRGRRALAISLLESGAEEAASSPERARLLGLLADVLFDGARGVMPTVDATEYIAAATRAARAALAIDPGERRALLTLGCAEVFGGMVLAQPMAPAFGHIEAALAAPGPPLTAAQHRRAQFFLGKAHQMEQRDADSDRHFRRALPPLFRPLFPLLRARLRSYP
jgi:hypothetical protein